MPPVSMADLQLAQNSVRKHYQADVLREAEILCIDGLTRNPDQPSLMHLLGLLMLRKGLVDFALSCVKRAAALDSTVGEYHIDLANLLERNQRHGDAAGDYRSEPHVDLGNALLRRGLWEEALRAFRTASMAAPRSVAASRALVTVLEALRRRSHVAGAWFSLGEALEVQDRLEDASSAYREVLKRKPTHLKAHLGLAYVDLRLARPRSAVQHFEKALTINSEHTAVHQGLGWASALVGDLERKWRSIGWANRYGPFKRRYFAQPLWDGSPLHGRTILLWSEAAVCDTLLLIRFAPLVKLRGARVIVECDRALVPLIRRMSCVDRAFARRTPLPAFDVQARIELLPGIFGVRLTTIPSTVPYLSAGSRDERVEHVRPRGKAGMIIGLVWSAGLTRTEARSRSIPLTMLEPLLRTPDTRFVSLQDGPPAAEMLALPSDIELLKLPIDRPAVDELASAMRHLDLVITIDGAAAHLAGALAVPVWTLLSTRPTWPWLCEGQRSPWYPTMRLFRQKKRNDWPAVVKRVVRALETMRSGEPVDSTAISMS